ncbi:aminopeptidase [Brevibacillus choshinensis]|uniref:Aminopeptidase n=1 Tax=Brevibacillus choshinensis TaxID=54911 RepID=A0ABR5NAK4_BRECH|nr:M28 family metallopeptidase [Brevibacillus choshinensis]KQL48583.1 aminopeptidase [Brevibacillus choshinensis]
MNQKKDRSASKGRRAPFLFRVSVLSALALTAVFPSQTLAASKSVAGFSPEKAEWQLSFEKAFAQMVSKESISRFSKEMSVRSGVVGTPGNAANVKFAVEELKKAGLEPEVKTYDVYMSVPKKIAVSQTYPEKRELQVMENLPKGTPYANEVIPGYNAYSAAGTVEAEIVYANYGRPEDFAELEKRGISVKDKIVITRYGANFRGVKPEQAEKRGAIGMLIYSDPADDGYTKGIVYPEGPWRPDDAIQRGSILYIFRYPGDPLTPGEASVPATKRLDPSEAVSLPQIPTTPLSYGEARPLLEAMQGDDAPASWQGGLPFTYKIGPGATKVRIALDIDYKNQPVNDVIVRIPGAKHPEQTVVIGAHRDTWAYGSGDNTSGWTTTLEIARVLGEMVQKGWQPDRTIVLAGWDGEEYGLLGSVEWAEEHRKELTENAVAYINMDGTGGQFFGASAVPSVKQLIYDVTKEVIEPRSGTSIYDDWYVREGRKDPNIGKLGSGSDYTPFIQHLGVPSLDMGFGVAGGLYHSAYDNLDLMERFIDPGYEHQAAGSQLVGITALRLANADALPFQYSAYAADVVSMLDEVAAKGTLGIDLSSVIAQARTWQASAKELEELAGKMIADGVTDAERSQLEKINAAMMQQERDLIVSEGLPSRPWYKHQIWAPGLTTGYAAQPLPAIAEAFQANDAKALQQAVERLNTVLKKATETSNAAK